LGGDVVATVLRLQVADHLVVQFDELPKARLKFVIVPI
jgi:hypothetical protein